MIGTSEPGAALRSAAKSPRDCSTYEEARRLASRRIGFSVTQQCPLRCAHCSASAGPEFKGRTLDGTFADKVVAEMPGLYEDEVRFVDFTGGEPTLAVEFVTRVSRAAVQAGMQCGIVSAAHWARSPRHARTFIERFPDIAFWDISTDLHHLPFVSLEQVEWAFDALRSSGRHPVIRIAHNAELTREEGLLIERVMDFAGKRIVFQEIGATGRGEAVADRRTGSARDEGPCPTTGLLIQHDGRAAPCCAPASHTPFRHALDLGDARFMSMRELLHAWRTDPLLQTLRVFGMQIAYRWLEEAGMDAKAVEFVHACDTCVALLERGELIGELSRRANAIEHKVWLAHVLRRDFGEPWLAASLVQQTALSA